MIFNNLLFKSVRTRSQLFNYQTVRWRRPRKPFWLGIAKSKMFVVPQPKLIPTPEEKAQKDLLETHYSIAYESLMKFIKFDNPALKDMVTGEGNLRKVSSELSERMSESFKNNERWNNECARRREVRLKSSMEAEMEKAIREIDVHEEIRMKKMEIIESIVRKEKVLSGSYITPENLDEEIEKCLDNVVCFDFAIDLEGNRYPGRETLESRVEITANS